MMKSIGYTRKANLTLCYVIQQSTLRRSSVICKSMSSRFYITGNRNSVFSTASYMTCPITIRKSFFSSLPSHEVIGMPALSPTMEAGSIGKWLINEGDKFIAGQAICEVETDKASVTFDAQDDGYLAKIIASNGEIKVGQPIMIVVSDLADVAAFKSYLVAPAATIASPVISEPVIAPVSVAPPTKPKGPLVLSPAARHAVESGNLDVSELIGTSRGGRISKADVILGIKSGLVKKALVHEAKVPATPVAVSSPKPVQVASTPAATAAFAVAPTSSTSPYTDVPNNKMRKIIAKRLTESKAGVPHSFYTAQLEIDALMEMRAELKESFKAIVSVNDIVIKASALALRDVPEANGSWIGSKWTSGGDVDISVAVATPNGLITPIVTGADKRGLLGINAAVKELAGRARDGKLKPEEFQGGTFTISNLGMFGISEFSAVINAPQACILAVGSGVPRVLPPRPGSSKPRVTSTLSVTLSADRRVVDESTAAAFLQALQLYLNSPKALVL